MSYYIDDDGNAIEAKEKAEIGSGNFEPLPAGLIAVAVVKEAGWQEHTNGANFINVMWQVGHPEEFKNRVVGQKLWVEDFDPNTYDEANMSRSNDEALEKAKKKRIKAKATLLTIDLHSGGKLKKKGTQPTNADLQSLVNKTMNITVQQYRFKDQTTGEMVVGNWVGEVGPRDDQIVKDQVLPTQPKKLDPTERRRVMSDDIPF
jgi:hypothetical protein